MAYGYQKVINNNVISAYDENQQEVVIMGKGIGFKAHTGDAIDESGREGFRIENEKLSRQFQEILENIPLEHMQLTSDIITYAKRIWMYSWIQSIYITLTDHINFAIQRQARESSWRMHCCGKPRSFIIRNTWWENMRSIFWMKTRNKVFRGWGGIYRTPFCECRVRYNDRQRYLCNDKYDTGILEELVKQEMGIEFDEESLHYERFVTHLKFLAQRLYRHELLKDEEIEFAKLMENKYPGEYECSKHIAEYIEKEYGGQISGEEIMFLAIHIKRVCMTD